ncbi:MAG: SMC-Scp complex subunit ScpB [Rectinema sp.]|jgi:segregation and condensation protein B|uniref:Transcriptional regulator n=1 Tax=uncultured spirochete TaxID=156406 RepID=A0A3P3XU74_9SPIR|nr:Transcriptional regulator [uncultured spirochete]
MNEQMDREAALISAILFLENEPISEEKLAKLSGFSEEQVSLLLQRLCTEFDQPVHGFAPTRSAGGWILAPKLLFWDQLKDHYGKKNEMKLSRAAMETLAIIAYSQPITRAEIEAIRGVNVDAMIRLLLSRNLIAELGKRNVPGKPMQYGTTSEFLKYFKLDSIEDLPKLDEIESARFSKPETPEG